PPVPPARRLFRVRRRAASRPQRSLHCRPRPVFLKGCRQRGDDGGASRGGEAARSPSHRRLCDLGVLRAASRAPHSAPRMIAFVFPGQGAQKVGMGKALAEAFPICRQTFAEADAALGEPLSTLCFEGPDDKLMLTENTQPAILAMSTAVARLAT